MTRSIGEGDSKLKRGDRTSLKDIITKNPDAVVTDYGIQLTKDNKATGVAVDNFQFGCVTTDFELDPEEEPKEEPGSLENIFGSVTGIFSS